MTGWPQARGAAYRAAQPLRPVDVALADAAGAVLAGPLWSLAPLPAFDSAAMDGWAVRGPGPWRLIGRVLAGGDTPPAVSDGQAVEIATGAIVPAGADGVLPYEQGTVVDDVVTGAPPTGRHLRTTGEECLIGTAVLPARSVLTPAAMGLAAAVGYDRLTIHPRPRVAALVTGDEVLRSGLPGGGRVRDAVGPMLAGAVASLGGRLVSVAYLRDEPDQLRAAVDDADADVVLTTGASSVGRADFLPAVVLRLGADVLFDGVAVKPGHPQLLAVLGDGRFLVGLPGNPLAALVGVVTTLAPLLAGLAGRTEPHTRCGRLGEALPTAPEVHRLVPVVTADGVAVPTGHGGSAMLRGAAVADAFAVVPPGRDLEPGDEVHLVDLP